MTDLSRVIENSGVVLKYCEGIKNPKIIEFGGGNNRLVLPYKVDELDYIRLKKGDMIADLEKRLPIKSNSYDIIFSSSVFEHVFNIKQLFNECHRILRPEGKLICFIPHFASLSSIHFLHQKFFSTTSFGVLTEIDTDFNYEFRGKLWKIVEMRITCPLKFLEPLINLNQRFYEGTILKNIVPPRFLVVVLEKVL